MVASFTGNGSIMIDSILVRGYGRSSVGDTLGYSKESALIKTIGLPLSLTTDTTGFDVYANGKISTFWVRHTMNFQLISQSCGFAPFYKISATRHSTLIDSVRVSDPVVDPKSVERHATNGQNITIYLHLTAK
jgi:hypothetical protein